MAPEMRRKASESDGQKADIYSLGKVLWAVLTEVPVAFDGQFVSKN